MKKRHDRIVNYLATKDLVSSARKSGASAWEKKDVAKRLRKFASLKKKPAPDRFSSNPDARLAYDLSSRERSRFRYNRRTKQYHPKSGQGGSTLLGRHGAFRKGWS